MELAGENPVHRHPSLPLPKPFDGSLANWTKWRQRFDRYRIAPDLALRSRAEQISTVLYATGDCADDILKTTDVNEETIEYDDLKQVFETHFGDRKKCGGTCKIQQTCSETWTTN